MSMSKYQRSSLRATAYTKEDLQAAVEKVRNKELTNYAASQMYGIPSSTLNDRVLEKTGIKSQTLGRPPAIPFELEVRLAECLRTLEKWGWGLSKDEVLDVVSAFVKNNNIKTSFQDSRPGTKWFVAFRERHKLSIKKPQTVEILRKKMTDPFVVDEYFGLLKQVLTEVNYDPERIWNLDETSVSLDPTKTKVVGAVGHPCTRTTAGTGKENITVLTTVNAAGKKLDPLIVFKGKHVYKEWMLEEKGAFEFEIAYAASKRGWMQADIFLNYMKKHVIPGLGTDRPQLMIYDGHVSHVDDRVVALAAENGLIVLKLPAHTSHLLQPLDLAVFKSFKSIWDKQLVSWQRLNIGKKVRQQQFAKMFAESWQTTNPEIIKTGFKKGGICPYNPSIIPKEKFNPTAYKRWEKYKAQNNGSKESSLKTLKQLCTDVINNLIHNSLQSSVTNCPEAHETKTFEDLLLEKIKQQPKANNVATKLTRIAKGAEVITRLNLEKRNETDESGLSETQSKEKRQNKKKKTDESGIQHKVKKQKTDESDLSGTQKKVKTQRKKQKTEHMNSYVVNEYQDIEKPSTSGTQKIKTQIKKTERKQMLNENDCQDNEKPGLSGIENKKTQKRTKGKGIGKKTKQPVTKKPRKRIERSPSIASTVVSEEISLHSNSDSLSDIFSMTTFMDLPREKQIETIIKEIYEEDKENMRNEDNEDYDTTQIHRKEICLQNNDNNENIHINNPVPEIAPDDKMIDCSKNINIISYQDSNANVHLNDPMPETAPEDKKDDRYKKINIISSQKLTSKVEYKCHSLKKIHPKSNLCLTTQPKTYSVGETILARYFKRSWTYYVGIIEGIDLKENQYSVSYFKTMRENDSVKFIVPKRKDVDSAVPQENIVKSIELLQFTEDPPQYTLTNDEDMIYF